MKTIPNAMRSVFLSALLTATTTSVLAATTYSVMPLQDLEYPTDSYSTAIGPTGTIAGYSFRLDSYSSVVWDDTGMVRELIPGDVGESQALDINATGQVLVYHYGPYIWDNGVLTPLNVGVSAAPLVGPLTFNDSAQVTGTGYFQEGPSYRLHAFLVSNGLTADLGALPGATTSWSTGLNNSGDVVGYSYTPDSQSRAVLWRNGSIIDLGTLPGEVSSLAGAVNDAGQVFGNSGVRMFRWDNGAMTDLGTYPGSSAVKVTAVNNRGDIVGQLYMGSGATTVTTPFVWSNGVFTDIGPVFKDSRGCTVAGINDEGQIAMSCHGGFRLSPTTPATDLGVVVSTGSIFATQGSPLTYTIEVSNVGSLAASNVQLSDVLPSSVTFVSVNTSQGNCSANGTVTCDLGNLASGAKAIVQLTVIPNVVGGLSHSASVSSDEVETNTPNNVGSAGVSVAAASADLGVTMTDSPDPVNRLANLTYSVSVKNSGPGSAGNVTVKDALPSSMRFVSASSSQGSCSGTATVTCNLGSMANGANANVTIVVQPRTRGTYTNKVSVSTSTQDSNAANNSASVTTRVK